LNSFYIAQQPILNTKSLDQLQNSTGLLSYLSTKDVQEAGVQTWWHGKAKKKRRILLIFSSLEKSGTPNGLCSSITEIKHIKLVKEPWLHSNCWKALGKMGYVQRKRMEKERKKGGGGVTVNL